VHKPCPFIISKSHFSISVMDNIKLLEKYNVLLEEVNRLTKENRLLKAQLGLMESEPSINITEKIKTKNSITVDELIESIESL